MLSVPVNCSHQPGFPPFAHFPRSSSLLSFFPAVPFTLFSTTSELFHFPYPSHPLSFLLLAHSFQKTSGYPLPPGPTNRSILEFSSAKLPLMSALMPGVATGRKGLLQAVSCQLSAVSFPASSAPVTGHDSPVTNSLCYHSPLAPPGRWHGLRPAVGGSADGV